MMATATTKRWAVYKKQADGSRGEMLGVQDGDCKDAATKAAIKAYGIPWRSLVVRLDRSEADDDPQARQLDKAGARRLCDEIRSEMDRAYTHAGNAYDKMLELHEGRGWKALGYSSWSECLTSEFGQVRSNIYKKLEAAKVIRELESNDHAFVLHGGQTEEQEEQNDPRDIPVRQLQALAKAPEGTRSEVLEVAVEAAGGKPTEAVVKAAVEAKRAAPDAPKEELVKATVEAVEKPKAPPKTFVNGEAKEDPAVEKLRAEGKIPVDAVVEVEDPGEDATDVEAIRDDREEHAAKVEAEQTDDEWLATLPLSLKLEGVALDRFRRDALLYHDLEKSRRSLKAVTEKAVKDRYQGTSWKGTYRFRVEQLLRAEHPKSWRKCPKTEDGGCGGTGQVELIGECRKCFGGGYLVR